jgi:predicted AlkP superfamily pyrophosphatase or phosphodiesterase
VLRKYKPNLMMYHPLNLDSTHHRYGPGSLASYNGLEYADKQVARLVEAVRDAGMLDRTTFLIVADHGFRVVKKNIHANAVLRANGLIRGEGAAIRCDVWGIPEGGTAMVYITDPAKRQQLTPRVKQMFEGVEGVAKVFEPSEYGPLGLPQPKDSDQAPDLLIAAKPGYAFAGANSGAAVTDVPPNTTPGSHGYLASDPDMETFLIAWGRGIKQGTKLNSPNSVDIAPTIARLLGLKMEGVAGHVLIEMLK